MIARLLAILLVLAAPAAGFAQDIPSRITQPVTSADFDRLMEIVSKCLVNREHDAVASMLKTVPSSPDRMQRIDKLLNDVSDCMNDDSALDGSGAQLRFNNLTLQRSLATAMLHRDFPLLPENSPVSEQSLRWYNGAILPEAYLTDEALTDQYIGRCTLSHDWRAARHFLMTKRRSDDEKGDLRKLAPTVVGCVPHDFQMSITAARLRDILAETTYLTLVTGKTSLAGVER